MKDLLSSDLEASDKQIEKRMKLLDQALKKQIRDCNAKVEKGEKRLTCLG